VSEPGGTYYGPDPSEELAELSRQVVAMREVLRQQKFYGPYLLSVPEEKLAQLARDAGVPLARFAGCRRVERNGARWVELWVPA